MAVIKIHGDIVTYFAEPSYPEEPGPSLSDLVSSEEIVAYIDEIGNIEDAKDWLRKEFKMEPEVCIYE